MLSCRLTTSFVKRSDPFGILFPTKMHSHKHAHTHTHKHKGCFLTGWTGHHLQGCDGMHTSMELWCKTRTVWNANHLEKGERKEERSLFTVESVYIMLLFVSLNWVLLWRAPQLKVMMGNIGFFALKQMVTRTRCFAVITTSPVVLFAWIRFLLDPPQLPFFYLLSSVRHFVLYFNNDKTFYDRTKNSDYTASQASDLYECHTLCRLLAADF